MGTRRSTRKRVVVELDTKAEDEADVDFWGQDAFAEEDEDDEFDDKALSDTGEVLNSNLQSCFSCEY